MQDDQGVPTTMKVSSGERRDRSTVDLSALDRHERAMLLFSGGKESVVLAHMLRSYRQKFDLVWVNTGAMFPHMVEFVRSFREDFNFVELKSDQAARFRACGLPARIIPIFNTPAGLATQREPRDRLVLCDWTGCCFDLRVRPALEYARAQGINLLVHGQRHEDGVSGCFGAQGAETFAPIWDWSAEQVDAYIARHNLRLPEQYAAGYRDSGECWSCTATLDPARFRWMWKRYPELMAQLKPTLAAVCGCVVDEWERAREAFDAAAGVAAA